MKLLLYLIWGVSFTFFVIYTHNFYMSWVIIQRDNLRLKEVQLIYEKCLYGGSIKEKIIICATEEEVENYKKRLLGGKYL